MAHNALLVVHYVENISLRLQASCVYPMYTIWFCPFAYRE